METGRRESPERAEAQRVAAKPVSPGATGSAIDAEIRNPKDERPLIDPEKPDPTGKTGPPDHDEWLNFFSRVILKVGMESYTDFAFRGIDENIVDPADLARIAPDKKLRDTIAHPFAAYCTKNKFTRKHGREVVALTESMEALVTLGIWMRRVNRIAAKYRPQRQQKLRIRPEEQTRGDYGPDQGSGESDIRGQRNGHVSQGVTIINPGGS